MSKSNDSTLLIVALAALLLGIFATSMYLNQNAKPQAEEIVEEDLYDDAEQERVYDEIEEVEEDNLPAPETTEENPVFTVVEKMPTFPGGDDAMKKYVFSNFNFPAEAQEVGSEGKVFIEFVVDENGKMTNIKIAKDGVGFGCGEEALRVIKKLAKEYTWTPGEQLGKKVRVKYRYPIIIRLK